MMFWLIGGAVFVLVCIGWLWYETNRALAVADDE